MVVPFLQVTRHGSQEQRSVPGSQARGQEHRGARGVEVVDLISPMDPEDEGRENSSVTGQIHNGNQRLEHARAATSADETTAVVICVCTPIATGSTGPSAPVQAHCSLGQRAGARGTSDHGRRTPPSFPCHAGCLAAGERTAPRRCRPRAVASTAPGPRRPAASDRGTGWLPAHKLLTNQPTRRCIRCMPVSHCTYPDLRKQASTTRKETGFFRLIISRSWVRAPPAPPRLTCRNRARWS